MVDTCSSNELREYKSKLGEAGGGVRDVTLSGSSATNASNLISLKKLRLAFTEGKGKTPCVQGGVEEVNVEGS